MHLASGDLFALAAAAAAGALYNVALVVQAHRLRAVEGRPPRLRVVPPALLDAGWLAATALAGGSFLLELFALHVLPLVVVMPVVAAGIVVLPLLGRWLLGEERASGWQLPSAAVVLGVLLVAIGAGHAAGHATLGTATSLALLAMCVAACAVTVRYVRSGIVTAFLAGAAFGVSGSFARVLATAHAWGAHWLLAGAGLIVTGLAGFVLEMRAIGTTSPARVGPVVLVLTTLVPIAAEQVWFGASLGHPAIVAIGVVLVLAGAARIAARLPT